MIDYKNITKNKETLKYENMLKLFGRFDQNSENDQLMICDQNHSHKYRKMLKEGKTPLNDIIDDFGSNLPLFDFKFFIDVEHFFVIHQTEGLKLIEFIIFNSPYNINGFYGKHSIPFFLANLPRCFQILSSVFMLASENNRNQVIEYFYQEDWLPLLCKYSSNQEYHVFISIIMKYVRDYEINENQISLFFDLCNMLIKSPNELALLNILEYFQNSLYTTYPNEITCMIILNISSLIKFESRCFFILSNTITEDTISFVQEIIPYFTNALKSNDEELILAASEFGVALVSYPQGYDLLSSSEGLNIIFFLAENSKYAIKKNMILIICEIIMQSNTEQRHFLISLNVLDILFAFIEIDQLEDISNILIAIEEIFDDADDSDQNLVIDKIIEYEQLLLNLSEYECKNVSVTADRLIQKIKLYKIL